MDKPLFLIGLSAILIAGIAASAEVSVEGRQYLNNQDMEKVKAVYSQLEAQSFEALAGVQSVKDKLMKTAIEKVLAEKLEQLSSYPNREKNKKILKSTDSVDLYKMLFSAKYSVSQACSSERLHKVQNLSKNKNSDWKIYETLAAQKNLRCKDEWYKLSDIESAIKEKEVAKSMSASSNRAPASVKR